MRPTWDDSKTKLGPGRHGAYLRKLGHADAPDCAGSLLPVGRYLHPETRPEHSYMLQCTACLHFVGLHRGRVQFDGAMPEATAREEVAGRAG